MVEEPGVLSLEKVQVHAHRMQVHNVWLSRLIEAQDYEGARQTWMRSGTVGDNLERGPRLISGSEQVLDLGVHACTTAFYATFLLFLHSRPELSTLVPGEHAQSILPPLYPTIHFVLSFFLWPTPYQRACVVRCLEQAGHERQFERAQRDRLGLVLRERPEPGRKRRRAQVLLHAGECPGSAERLVAALGEVQAGDPPRGFDVPDE